MDEIRACKRCLASFVPHTCHQAYCSLECFASERRRSNAPKVLKIRGMGFRALQALHRA